LHPPNRRAPEAGPTTLNGERRVPAERLPSVFASASSLHQALRWLPLKPVAQHSPQRAIGPFLVVGPVRRG
jgi:hypothetical protein